MKNCSSSCAYYVLHTCLAMRRATTTYKLNRNPTRAKRMSTSERTRSIMANQRRARKEGEELVWADTEKYRWLVRGSRRAKGRRRRQPDSSPGRCRCCFSGPPLFSEDPGSSSSPSPLSSSSADAPDVSPPSEALISHQLFRGNDGDGLWFPWKCPTASRNYFRALFSGPGNGSLRRGRRLSNNSVGSASLVMIFLRKKRKI